MLRITADKKAGYTLVELGTYDKEGEKFLSLIDIGEELVYALCDLRTKLLTITENEKEFTDEEKRIGIDVVIDTAFKTYQETKEKYAQQIEKERSYDLH